MKKYNVYTSRYENVTMPEDKIIVEFVDDVSVTHGIQDLFLFMLDSNLEAADFKFTLLCDPDQLNFWAAAKKHRLITTQRVHSKCSWNAALVTKRGRRIFKQWNALRLLLEERICDL